jgi:hypothetical protein
VPLALENLMQFVHEKGLIVFEKEKNALLPLMISRLLTRKGGLETRPIRISLNA